MSDLSNLKAQFMESLEFKRNMRIHALISPL